MPIRLLAAVLAAALSLIPAHAATTSSLVNYQGHLTNSSGAALTGTYSITFRLFSQSSGGTPIWAETQGSVGVTNGAFTVLLGSLTQLQPQMLVAPVYLELQVGADAPMTPRQILTSAPNAFRAAIADTVASGADVGGPLTVTQLNYSPARTGKVTVHASAFTPISSSVTYASNWTGGNDRYLASGGASASLSAPLVLPDGVLITGVSCAVVDNSAVGNLNGIGIAEALANNWACLSGPTSGASPAVQNLSQTCAWAVNNSAQILFLRFMVSNTTDCGASCSLYGCTVTYTYATEGR